MSNFERILVIGAHPDDAEFHAAGLMLSQSKRGSQIGILSLTDGSAGHQTLARAPLAARRRREALAAAQKLDADVNVWNEPDGELTDNLALRKRLLVAIRKFAPDLIVTHRPYDYHPDHRATARLVQDACFLLRVPNVEPDIPALPVDPVVVEMCDFFTRPVEFRADIVVPVADHLDEIVSVLACHESQVFEWLPHVMGIEIDGERLAWLKKFYSARPARIARRYAPKLKFAEAFEISEYGRAIDARSCAGKLGLT